MGRSLLIVLIMIGFVISSNAQPFNKRVCAADSVHQQLYKTDATYKKRRDEIEDRVRKIKERNKPTVEVAPNRSGLVTPPQFRTQPRMQSRALTTNQTANRTIMSASAVTATQIVTIPVVVHVLYNNVGIINGDSISMAQIQAQIDTLNKDFRKLNADTSKIPLVFKDLAADFQIQFCLAQFNESGLPTTGVIYKYTPKPYFVSTNDSVKFNIYGGDNAWDCNRYLNIWVCDLMGSMGYSSFPGSACERDGIVIHYSVFGSGGPTRPPYNMGRTATHEVGHWLNLLHIWADDNNKCTGTDYVDDTPNQDGPNYGCPTFPVASGCSTLNGDMFMNYMDYGDDACIVMFSKGQKDRIEATLSCGGPRWAILSSTACTGIPYDTVSSSSVTNVCPNTATINWTPTSQAISYVIEYKVDSSATWSDTTVVGTSLSFTTLNPATTYQYRITCQCLNGNSKASAINSFQTKNTCVIPNLLEASATSHLTAQATWNPVANASSYNVRYKLKAGGDGTWITQNTTSTSVIFSGLTPSTLYESQVQAVCECESSAYSASDTFQTTLPPCAMPVINTPVLTSCNRATLSWNAITYAGSYQFRYKPTSSPTWLTGTTSSTSSTLIGLLPATNYEFQVQANCGGTNLSSWTSSTTFTTTTLTCSDTYESNNKIGDAKTLSVNACYTAYIDKGADKDYYKIITTASQPNLKITLSNLPANYNITLYASNGTTVLGSSANTGNTTETIVYPASTGATYYIYVFPAASTQFSASNCYHLSISANTTNTW